MDDQILENRKLLFQKGNAMDILSYREQKRLSLRKEKIEEIFFNKRRINSASLNLEVDPYKLNIPKEFLDNIYNSQVSNNSIRKKL